MTSEMGAGMKYWLGLNWAIAALSAVMALVMAVVCLIYGLYLGDEPTLEDEFPLVVAAFILFTVVAGLVGAALWGFYRQRRWAWGADVAAIAAVGLVVLFFQALR